MKKLHFLALIALAIIVSSVTLNHKTEYKDGVFTGESQSKYTNEPYWGQVTLEIKNDKIISMTFQIMDKDKKEVFGPEYEKYFKDNAEYINQCRIEVKGIKAYSEAFQKDKNIDHVDGITGATWSYNIMKDALKVTLEKARNK